MANYYYLVSSLPMLSLDQDLPMSYFSFLSMCKSSMSPSDFEEISKAKLSPEKGAKNHLMRKWEDYLTSVSSTLKEERSRKLGWAIEKGEYVKVHYLPNSHVGEVIERSGNTDLEE